MKIQLRSLTQVSHVTKKRKKTNKCVKKPKKLKKVKASLKLPSIYLLPSPPVNDYTIIASTGTDKGEKAVGKRFHGVVNLLIANCVD